MIYPTTFENKIRFNKIRSMLEACCQTDMGKELVNEIKFSYNSDVIAHQLGETAEFMKIITAEDFPDGRFQDARDALNRIKVVGMFLSVQEMVILKNSLESLHAILHYFNGKENIYPLLCSLSSVHKSFPSILAAMDRIISKTGTIKDSASRELGDIRHNIAVKQSGISRRMQSLLQQAQSEGWAEKETSISIRDGRMVIPVPSAYKRKINGIVHDESATGKTSFIEPAEIVETNNEIRELELEEKREIIKILRAFADDLRPEATEIINAYSFLAQIDLIRAKAKFAIQIDAQIPKISKTSEMMWFNARHPLLYLSLKNAGKKIVPLKLEMNEEQRIIVISGPNAGGKSVCLQTAGLLQYMFQCGLPVPADDHSLFGIFKNILIDMGDEQSIENDLSTYSSHLMNMKAFLKYGDESTLILIDEFGTGTEPMLGGAIAQAMLEALNEKHVRGVITTHYTNLKHFAAETTGIANGAMLYDNSKMLPLFELQIGKPGSSFAFEIARKIGLPKDILDKAAATIGQDNINYDKHLKDIARDKRYWEEKRRKIHENEKRLDEVMEKYNGELSEASRMKKEILAEAKAKAAEIIEQANKSIEQTIKTIRERQAEKLQTRKARQKLEEEKNQILKDEETDKDRRIREQMEKIQRRRNKKQSEAQTNQNRDTEKQNIEDVDILVVGDYVKIGNTVGEVLEINGKNATVALGNMRSVVKTTSLQKISKTAAKSLIVTPPTPNRTVNVSENLSQKKLEFKPEIDVRGLRGDEALMKVTEFIDHAIMLNIHDVRILHGTGTGILRSVIRDYLKTVADVISATDEKVQLGGAGITVVKLN